LITHILIEEEVRWFGNQKYPLSIKHVFYQKKIFFNMKYSKQWLLANKTEHTEYLLFWGHSPSKDGSITKTCFSQWWVANFTIDGINYPTAEHWMMAEKARLFKDNKQLANILVTEKPAAAKAFGRKVENFDPSVWEQKKGAIVIKGNVHKFSQNLDLQAFLLATGDKIIVEASPRDQIWGIGLGTENPLALQPEHWRGRNLLGFALMEVRDILS
jgi:ribA/ribD-fused uncharacterized protein